MGFITTEMINKSHYDNECQNFIVYGPLGYGKTSFALQVLMELYNTEDPDILSKYFFFDPAEFLSKVTQFKDQVPAVAWDDAGVWLYYMDYQSSLLKNVSKLMQLIRTRTAAVLFTTPTPSLVFGKLRNFPQTITLKVSKVSGHLHERNLRRVTAYRSWMMPDLQKLRVKKLFVDDYSCMLPNDLFKWYSEQRRGYIEQVEEKLQSELPKSLQDQIKADNRRRIQYNILLQNNKP